MSTTLVDREATLRRQADAIRSEIENLLDIDDPTPEQSSRIEELAAKTSRLAGQLEEVRELRMAQIREYASKPDHLQSGDGARVTPVPGCGPDPWEDSITRSAPGELRDRALFACERDEKITDDMAGVIDVLSSDPTDVANVGTRWMIATSRPAYRSAFRKFLRGPEKVALTLDDAERAAVNEVESVRAQWNEGTGNQGGFAVVPDYQLSLMIQNAGSTNPFRAISKVIATSSNVVNLLGTAGVTASWLTESGVVGDDTPLVTQPKINVHKAAAWLEGSFEVFADSNLDTEVSALLADAKNNLEATAMATGTGTNEPWGVVTRCAGLGAYVFGNSGSTVEKEIVISDVFSLSAALPERYQQGASIVAHRAILNQLRQLDSVGSGNNFWVDLGAGIPSTLIGYPCYAASAMDSLVSSGSEDDVMLLGDFRQGYAIADRIGMSIMYAPLVFDPTTGRPNGRSGFFAHWRVGADVTDQTAASGLVLLHK